MKPAHIVIAAILLAGAAGGVSLAYDRIPALHGLSVPSDSPVSYRGIDDEYLSATFAGRFVLTGTFMYGCEGCKYRAMEDDLSLYFVPDPGLEKRLPHWIAYDQDMRIRIYGEAGFGQSMGATRSDIMAGKIHVATGRASIVVDHFTASIDCGTANYSATFVAMAQAPVTQHASFDGAYGCG